jgi:hypothetical protein
VTKIISVTIKTLVTLKAGAKHELLFNELASELCLWSRGSSLAAALGVTKFITIKAMHSVTLCCSPKSDLSSTKSLTRLIAMLVMNFFIKLQLSMSLCLTNQLQN